MPMCCLLGGNHRTDESSLPQNQHLNSLAVSANLDAQEFEHYHFRNVRRFAKTYHTFAECYTSLIPYIFKCCCILHIALDDEAKTSRQCLINKPMLS